MIVYGGAAPASVRRGEFHPFPGARSRCRAIPYPGFEIDGADPWKGTYARAEEIDAGVGPPDPALWREAIVHAGPGKVLVGTAAPAEEVYGTAAAAIAAARDLGRSVIVVEAVDARTFAPATDDLARVVLWTAGPGFWTGFSSRKEPSGVALPLIPGWTGSESFLEEWLDEARAAGARFAVPFELAGEGASRAAIHADFARLHPPEADDFFDAIHHRDWETGVREARAFFRRAAAAVGIPGRVPAIAGSAEFAGNARLIEAFEVAAETAEEPGASRFLAAARRVEDFGRDIEEVARGGNLRLLWPLESPEARIAAELLSVRSA